MVWIGKMVWIGRLWANVAGHGAACTTRGWDRDFSGCGARSLENRILGARIHQAEFGWRFQAEKINKELIFLVV